MTNIISHTLKWQTCYRLFHKKNVMGSQTGILFKLGVWGCRHNSIWGEGGSTYFNLKGGRRQGGWNSIWEIGMQIRIRGRGCQSISICGEGKKWPNLIWERGVKKKVSACDFCMLFSGIAIRKTHKTLSLIEQ